MSAPIWINDTNRDQYRSFRRDRLGNLVVPTAIVIHTAEGGSEWTVGRLAELIRNRDRAGSYHHGVDPYGREAQYRAYINEAFHVGASNGTQRANAIGIGLAFTFSKLDWATFNQARTTTIMEASARAFLQISAWSTRHTGHPIPPRHLTPAEYWAGERGYIFHSELDPENRSDPGEDFPEEAFINAILGTTTTEEPEEPMTEIDIPTEELQEGLVAAGIRVSVDGIAGPQTTRGVRLLLEEGKLLLALRDVLQRDASEPVSAAPKSPW